MSLIVYSQDRLYSDKTGLITSTRNYFETMKKGVLMRHYAFVKSGVHVDYSKPEAVEVLKTLYEPLRQNDTLKSNITVSPEIKAYFADCRALLMTAKNTYVYDEVEGVLQWVPNTIFAACGSSDYIAHMLHAAGHEVRSIYNMAARHDPCLTVGNIHVIERESIIPFEEQDCELK